MHLVKVFADIHRTGLDHILCLWHSDAFERNAGLGFNLLDEHLGLGRVERDTGSRGPCSRSPATSVDVSLRLLRWLNLDDEVDIGYVDTSRGDICSDEDLEFAVLEAL